MRVIAVPVKSLDRAKGRLAGVLTPMERAALTLAMLDDVLDACGEMPGWQVWVITPDESILEAAARRRARPIEEEDPGLNVAIAQVEEEAGRAEALAIVLGDLPMLTPLALAKVLHTLGPVVAAPSGSDEGTNVLLRRPPSVIPARFGTDSFRKHRDTADQLGVPFAEVNAPELAFDLDRPEDIPALLSWNAGQKTRAICLEMGIAERLPVQKHA
jgi:2-phospho-L-lactate guanylyltransferase